MQRKDDNTPVSPLVKTALVLGAVNLLTSPTYLVSRSVGLLLTIATNIFSLVGFHQIGQSSRYGFSLLNFFGSSNNNIRNAYQNIITGGEAIADEITVNIPKAINSFIKPRR